MATNLTLYRFGAENPAKIRPPLMSKSLFYNDNPAKIRPKKGGWGCRHEEGSRVKSFDCLCVERLRTPVVQAGSQFCRADRAIRAIDRGGAFVEIEGNAARERATPTCSRQSSLSCCSDLGKPLSRHDEVLAGSFQAASASSGRFAHYGIGRFAIPCPCREATEYRFHPRRRSWLSRCQLARR